MERTDAEVCVAIVFKVYTVICIALIPFVFSLSWIYCALLQLQLIVLVSAFENTGRITLEIFVVC
jgi:hypothetical protein